jgi:hypothetical protein
MSRECGNPGEVKGREKGALIVDGLLPPGQLALSVNCLYPRFQPQHMTRTRPWSSVSGPLPHKQRPRWMDHRGRSCYPNEPTLMDHQRSRQGQPISTISDHHLADRLRSAT